MIRKLKSGEYRLYSRQEEPENRAPAQFGHVFEPQGGREA